MSCCKHFTGMQVHMGAALLLLPYTAWACGILTLLTVTTASFRTAIAPGGVLSYASDFATAQSPQVAMPALVSTALPSPPHTASPVHIPGILLGRRIPPSGRTCRDGQSGLASRPAPTLGVGSCSRNRASGQWGLQQKWVPTRPLQATRLQACAKTVSAESAADYGSPHLNESFHQQQQQQQPQVAASAGRPLPHGGFLPSYAAGLHDAASSCRASDQGNAYASRRVTNPIQERTNCGHVQRQPQQHRGPRTAEQPLQSATFALQQQRRQQQRNAAKRKGRALQRGLPPLRRQLLRNADSSNSMRKTRHPVIGLAVSC